MATLYLDHRDLKVTQEGRAVVLYQSGERRGTVPMGMLERVVARGRVQMDTGLLAALAEQGVGLLVLGGRGGRALATVLGRPHADARRRLAQYRRADDPDWCRDWSRRLVRHKLLGQARLLRHALARRPELRQPLFDAEQSLRKAAQRLAAPDAGLDVDSLRGVEGAGAAAYFSAYTRLFADGLEFRGRNRRPPKDPVNACLSLAYTLVHFEAVTACHTAGLDPLLGFFHLPAYGRESLAADLLEPVRPHVDRWVWELFRERRLRTEQFSRDGQACLLGKAGRREFYAAYEHKVPPLRRLLRRTAMGLAKKLLDDPTAPGQGGMA